MFNPYDVIAILIIFLFIILQLSNIWDEVHKIDGRLQHIEKIIEGTDGR